MSKKIIGVYPMFNTGGICVHAIDDAEDKVLASVNGENPEWCEMAAVSYTHLTLPTKLEV